ncbi:hypothetical protein WR25_13748 [Diploscapter pachys]|uniref:Uncharacterized protein n=1 Tax=Diploscapter pachys TaxID=2018661 RepID=A0A2A2JE06_9BILA|nr:hypothetical protein WR25_13748 [Diploscapter pachys]
MNICQSLLLHPNCKEFFEDLVTEDDSWVLYDNATQHAVWIPRGDEPPAVPKPDHHSHSYHLFHPLKLFLASKSFAKYEDPKLALSDFFDSQLPEFWAKGISDLPIRWTTVVDNLGDYIVD